MEFWALYLPAFHQIDENDKWWGKGFTEWDNVKKGRPLYKNHIQPQIPLNGYYDLSKIEDIKKQVDLANEYGVDGFVFYHYWFKDGKKLLEKPAETLLANKNLNIKFSFCWANEPWSRTWDGKNTDILMPQEYGSDKEWIAHIKYLYQFFEDTRYQKINGKPVLYIYSASRIPNFNRMIEIWNEYLKSVGMKKLFIVEYISTFNTECYGRETDAVLEFEPLYTTRFDISIANKVKRLLCKKFGVTDYQNYDDLWKRILQRKRTYKGKIIFRSCFCAWDNSPRKSKKSMIVKDANPIAFKKYLYLLTESSRANFSKDILVINAWNEWGEGAMLEPTVNDNYKYLQSIKEIKLKLKDN